MLASQRHHPPKTNSGAVGPVYELPKKWGCSLGTPRPTHRPLTEDSNKVMEKIPMGRRHHDKTSLVLGNQEKGGFPSPSLDDAFILPKKVERMLAPLRTCCHP